MRDQDVLRRFDLLELSLKDYWTVFKCGLLITTLAYVGAGIIAASTETESWFFVFAPPLIGLLYAVWMVYAANRRLTPPQRERLTEQRDLLERHEASKAASDATSADLMTTQARINHLLDLALRMKRLDAESLPERMAEVEGVIKMLERRVRTDGLLIAGYDHECQLLAVEIEALDIVLSDEGTALDAKLADLAALEESIRDGRRRRAAELEVSRFLAESGGSSLSRR